MLPSDSESLPEDMDEILHIPESSEDVPEDSSEESSEESDESETRRFFFFAI